MTTHPVLAIVAVAKLASWVVLATMYVFCFYELFCKMDR